MSYLSLSFEADYRLSYTWLLIMQAALSLSILVLTFGSSIGQLRDGFGRMIVFPNQVLYWYLVATTMGTRIGRASTRGPIPNEG